MCLLACGSATAIATPVTWYLSNVVFSDGGIAQGQFTYDVNAGPLGTYSGVNISVSGGGFSNLVYTTATPVLSNQVSLNSINVPRTLELSFVPVQLTNGGGTVALTFLSGELGPAGARSATGFVTTTPPGGVTPEPTSLTLMSLGVGLLIFARMKFRPAKQESR